MASKNNNVLIFGPTGAVGGAAALEAAARGATLWLAMRNPSKSIPGLSSSTSSYHRIQADLSNPDTLSAAVEESGAKSAFVYAIFDSSDGMLASFTALKDAGIEYVVLLSSYSVQGAPEAEKNHHNDISSLHAKTEISLRKTGIKYTAVRPAFFNSNAIWFYGSGLVSGQVTVLHPDTKLDWITPSDIGTVAGALLAGPPQTSEIVYLCGPELLSQREALPVIGKALGRELTLNEVNEEQWIEELAPTPRPLLQTLAVSLRSEGVAGYPQDTYKQATENIEKITGRQPTKLEEWVKQNKDVIEKLGQS